MIFADKLIDLRKKNGWSQEELAEKLEVSRQTISKWEGALSMPDLGRMLKIAQLFGVTTDYLIKDEQGLTEATVTEEDGDENPVHRISMEQAVDFLNMRDVYAGRTAAGVMLCIFSPIILILLCGAQEEGRLAVSEAFVSGLGVSMLLVMVALAVGIFVYSGLKLSAYEFFENEAVETDYGVDSMVRERRNRYASKHTQLLIAGITLCVLCSVPLFATMMFIGEGNEWAEIMAVAALLFMVGIGVLCIVRTAIVWESFQMLLEEGDYTREHKAENKRNEAIAAIYWGLTTAAFLGYSFVTDSWEKSWIIWPVAGVLYGVLVAVLRIVRKNRG